MYPSAPRTIVMAVTDLRVSLQVVPVGGVLASAGRVGWIAGSPAPALGAGGRFIHNRAVMTDLTGRLDAIGRLRLADLPTPVEDAPRLAAQLGLSRLLIKRDDKTGLALGGNKARKLEYDLAEAVREGADVLVTIGGTQSNHAVMTAAAARRLGLDVKLVLGGPDFERFDGNLLLDVMLGAEIRYLVDDDDNDSLAAAMDEWMRELRAAGRRPFALPLGGSSGTGALGYVRAMMEIVSQIGDGPVQIVTAVGSCGTFAGLNLGARCFLPRARVIGISVSRKAPANAVGAAELSGDARVHPCLAATGSAGHIGC